MGKTKQTKMTNYNIKFDRISRQQYVIVFNETRWVRWSSTAAYIVPSPTQKNLSCRCPRTGTCLFNFL